MRLQVVFDEGRWLIEDEAKQVIRMFAGPTGQHRAEGFADGWNARESEQRIREAYRDRREP
jgi:hypothetical protein